MVEVEKRGKRSSGFGGSRESCPGGWVSPGRREWGGRDSRQTAGWEGEEGESAMIIVIIIRFEPLQ